MCPKGAVASASRQDKMGNTAGWPGWPNMRCLEKDELPAANMCGTSILWSIEAYIEAYTDRTHLWNQWRLVL